MDNNFKFKTRHVSIVQQSSSVVNSFVSSVELIQAMTYKLKRDTIQSVEKFTYIFKMRQTWNNTCASTTLNTRKKNANAIRPLASSQVQQVVPTYYFKLPYVPKVVSFSTLFVMFTLTWITEKEIERVIENKGDEWLEEKHENFIAAVRK